MNIEKLSNKKQIKKLMSLFMFVYMASYITRTNYGAIISELEQATHFSKQMLSMAVTGSFITYGVGQIISGFLGDHISPKKLVSTGLIITVSMNLLLPFCNSTNGMLFSWCINGFAQALIWPPMVKLMTAFLYEKDYVDATVKVNRGGALGTILVYLLAPILIVLFSWKKVFAFSAVCGVIMLLLWKKYAPDIEIERANTDIGNQKKDHHILFTPQMICVMVAIALQGMLRDGVTTWMPSYISETYNLSNVISILSGVLLPVFSIICYKLVSILYNKKINNPLTCAGVVFGTGMICTVILLAYTGKNTLVSIVFTALLTGCMHGVNLMLVCILPSFFQKYGNVSTVSGVLNSCTYVGSAVSTYGVALIAENYNWNVTIFIWIMIALIGTVACFAASKKPL